MDEKGPAKELEKELFLRGGKKTRNVLLTFDNCLDSFSSNIFWIA